MTNNSQVETHEFELWVTTIGEVQRCGKCNQPRSHAVHQTHERVESEPELKPGGLPWDERIVQLSIHPDAASKDDVARLASELLEYQYVRAGSQPPAESDWKRRYEDESAIVNRVWRALGIETYEQAKGLAIDEIVADLRTRALASSALAQLGAKCVWAEDSDGVLQTTCNNAFQLEAGNLEENGFKFCCFCGVPLKESAPSSDM